MTNKANQPCPDCGQVHENQDEMDARYEHDPQYRRFSDTVDQALDLLIEAASLCAPVRGTTRHTALYDLVLADDDPLTFWGILNNRYINRLQRGTLTPAPGDADLLHQALAKRLTIVR